MYVTEPVGNDWQHGILGCFENPKICILAVLFPPFIIGKNAEHFGENCFLIGLAACCGLNFGPILRWRLRQMKNLKGSVATDILAYAVLPICAMIQEAKEIGWDGSSSAMARS